MCSNCCLLNFYVTAIGLSIINKMQRKRKVFRDWDKGLVGRDQAAMAGPHKSYIKDKEKDKVKMNHA